MTDPKNVLRAGPEDPNFQHLGKRKDGKDDGDWPAVEPFSFPEIEEGEIKMAGADTKRRKVQRSSALESRDSSSILPCPPAFQKLLSPIPVSISPFSVLAIDVGDDDDEDEDDDDKLSEIKKVRALSLSGNVSNTCDASAYDQDDVHALIPPFINPVLQSIYRDQKAGIQFRLDEFLMTRTNKFSIGMAELQNLVLWCFDIGQNPRWAIIKNKPLIEKVVVLSIGGLDHLLIEKYNALLPSLSLFSDESSGKPLPLNCPGAKYRLYSSMKALLEYEVKESVKKKQKQKQKQKRKEEEEKKITADELVLSVAQMHQLNYPLPPHISRGVPEPKYPLPELYADTGNNGELKDFISLLDGEVQEGRKVLAVDCEMCLTKTDKALTRVSLVDMHGDILYDSFVKPEQPITDYLTKYSGVSEEILRDVTTTIHDVHKFLLENVPKQTILLGHSLENDLRALKLFHLKVVDTVVLYPHDRGLPSRNSLRFLAERHLSKTIQRSETGHNSVEDAHTCLELLNLKLERGINYGISSIKTAVSNIFDQVKQKKKHASTMIDRVKLLKDYESSVQHAIGCSTDFEVSQRLLEEIAIGDSRLVWAQFHDVVSAMQASSSDNGIELTIKDLDLHFAKIHSSLRPNQLLIIHTGLSNEWRYKKFLDKKNSGGDWTGKEEEQLLEAVNSARKGIAYAYFK